MMYTNLAILAVFVFIYSITSGRLERTPINGALVFVMFGLAFGPFGLGWLDLSIGSEGLRLVAELTLALVLFADAANANLGVLRKQFRIPERMLLVGLPLTILLGFGVGVVLFDGLSLIEVAILATMLAPTDAALGKAVVTNESVPVHMREGLNVESGLNDGICVPVLFIFLALATGTGHEGGTTSLALTLLAEELGIGAAVGIVVTLVAVWVGRPMVDRGWVTETWRLLPVVALATTCFTVAQVLHGSGFIAAFVGGLLFGWLMEEHRKHRLLVPAEGIGDTMSLLTWVTFGAVVVAKYLDAFTWQVVVYALLSLTVIRMLPVFLSLFGCNMRTDEKLFMGWFGPRGLASVVFGIIVLNEHLPGGDTITLTVACTVLLSVIAHGISANPLARRLGQKQASS